MAHMKFAQELQAKRLQVGVWVMLMRVAGIVYMQPLWASLFIVQRAAVQERGH